MDRLYLVFILFLLFSCKPDSLSKKELTAFVSDEENGLKKSIDLGNIKVEVFYKPADLMVHQEISHDVIDITALSALREKYKNYYYFIVSLSSDNKDALQQTGDRYGELIQTLSFRMNDYVTLTTPTMDTIPVRDFILNRTYGLSKSTDLLFVFDNEKALDKEWVQFNLNELGLGIGNQRFRFRVSDLQQVPGIKFDMLKGS